MTTKPHAVVFDLDGTLVDSATSITVALNELLQQRGLPTTNKAIVRNTVSLGSEALVRGALGAHVRDIAADIAEFRTIYRAIEPHPSELFPHTLEMLETLKARGHAMAVCTNKPEDLALHVCHGTGLTPYMRAIIGSREGRKPKPDPAPVFETLKLMDTLPAEAVYVGDSEVDAETAKNAGLPFYFVAFGYAIGEIEHIEYFERIDDFRHFAGKIKA